MSANYSTTSNARRRYRHAAKPAPSYSRRAGAAPATAAPEQSWLGNQALLALNPNLDAAAVPVLRNCALAWRETQPSAPGVLPDQELDALRKLGKQFGNRFLQALVQRQQLPMSQPGDATEREADDLAVQAMFGERHGGARSPAFAEKAQTPPADPALRLWQGLEPGRPLDPAAQRYFAGRFDLNLAAVRVHSNSFSASSAEQLGARAYAFGQHVVFARGAYAPHTATGQHLLAHELAHLHQQARRGQPMLARQHRTAAPDLNAAAVAGAAVPDDETLESGIVWPDAEQKNQRWWTDLIASELRPFRDLDPVNQPRAYANQVIRAQRLLRDSGVRFVEGARLDLDGVLGPRTFLALLRVAQNPNQSARAQIQGLGFDLDAIAQGERAIHRARAYARVPELLVQAPIKVLGENAVRYYDVNYSMVDTDCSVLDDLIFNGAAPVGTNRADRIELLHRLYGQDEQHLHGTVTLVRVHRDFIHTRIDIARAVEHDRRQRIDRSHYFTFAAQSPSQLAVMRDRFGVTAALDKAIARASPERVEDVRATAELLLHQAPEPAAGAVEIGAVLLAVYLPVVDNDRRLLVVGAYLAEKAQREQAEQQRIDEHNRAAAHERADRLAALIEASDMYGPEREARLRTELERAVREEQFFGEVLDDLAARPDNLFNRLFDTVEGISGDAALGLLVEAARAGPYRDNARVRQAQAELIRRHTGLRTQGYVVDDAGGAVLLDHDRRMTVGQIAGEVDHAYWREEDREQLRPDAQQRLEAELEHQARAYMARLLDGSEPARSQEEIGRLLVPMAWQAAGLDTDRDIESVVLQESVQLLGVRRAPERGDGVPRFEVQYRRVQRILGGEAGDTNWAPIPGSEGWRSESEFEYDLFWYPYAQSAAFMETAAKVVTIGAVIAVAWEVGLIGALVSAGGGALPVGLSIGISLGIYMLTHRRWTLEGLLLAGVEGYLAAVGFRVFAPAGQAVGRLVLPATLEEVTFRRVIAAWLLRHGTVGAFTGGALGPASLFMHDIVRVAGNGGRLSSFTDYLRVAGLGMLFGAVFEIGGSALLAPIFRAADSSVLARLSDVVAALRSHEPPITPSQWMSEVAGSLSAFRQFLGHTLDDALANGIFETVRARLAQAGSAWLTGVRGTLQSEIIELAGVSLSREGTNGLERLLRLGRGTLGDDALATLLQHARRTPERIDPWLRFLAGIDDAATGGLVARGQLRPLLDAENVLSLAARRTSAELNTLMATRFANSLDELEQFATRVNSLEPALGNQVMDALAARGTAVTPRSLLRIAESAGTLEPEVLSGLRRVLAGSDASRLDVVLEAMSDDQVAPFLRSAQTAADPELQAMQRVVAHHDPASAAWGLRLPAAQAETLLNQLTPAARSAINDITSREAQDVVAALGIDRVNRALSLGTTGPLRGSHLRALRQHWHDASVNDYLDWAASQPKRLDSVASLAENLGPGATRLSAPTPLAATTLVVDSNAVFAIEALMRGTPFASLTPNRRQVIDAIRSARGLGPYVDPPAGSSPLLDYIVGPNFDLRASVTVAGETVLGEAAVGPSPVIGRLRGIAPARANPDYPRVIDDLRAKLIGSAKGAGDRTVVADAMFADTTPGVVPTLVSADRNVVQRLAREYAVPTRFTPVPGSTPEWIQLATTFPSGRFTIAIFGHRLDVIFR